MDIYKQFDHILDKCINIQNETDYSHSISLEDEFNTTSMSANSMSANSMSSEELVKWSTTLIKQLEKSKKFRVRDLPKYIIKNNEIINRICVREKKLVEIDAKKPNNLYDFVTLIDDKEYLDNLDNTELVCSALTKNYKQCKQQVKYKIENLNKDGEDNKHKYNVLFCTQHVKQLAESDDQKTLKYGFYFDSDIYIKN